MPDSPTNPARPAMNMANVLLVLFILTGEMLPPAFTYFMDMSEFLRRYPHIGVKLGEDHKHILQTFIEGKLEVEAKKHIEHMQRLEEETRKLKKTIRDMRGDVSTINNNMTNTSFMYAAVKLYQFVSSCVYTVIIWPL